MKWYVPKKSLFFIFLCVVTCSFSQDELKLQKGIVINSLGVPTKEGSHYSIYLPTSFDLTKQWPVLLGFDSTGNTRNLTALFSQAAEALGYVIVVSNFSENLKTIQDKTNYVAFFTNHILSLLPIHDRRVYVFGNGEDAPLNSLIPLIYREFNGVIAMNNSYYYSESIEVKKNFSYAGVISDKNFRYQDFINIKRYLKRKAITSDVYVYDNDQEKLPPEDLLQKVLTSFTLQDMLKGKIAVDSVWVQKQYQKQQNEVNLLIEKKSFIKAYDELKRMRSWYHLFFEIDTLKEQQKRIRKVSDYKKLKRLKSRYNNQEIFLQATLLMSLEEDVEFKQYENLGWWQYRVEELNKLIATRERHSSNMAIRILGYLKDLISQYKIKSTTKKEKVIDKKIFLNVLSTIIDPQDFDSYKAIMYLSSIDQDKQTALFYLEKMLQNGYKDIEGLYTIEGTLALKISREYNALVKKYLGTSKYHSY
ncbi:hypothetical protein [Aquimarina sp. RZ0]|uniref:hypothetical protein n=1 Tax=Aquimarina sp. RZ0 TaxID=2607730 RepID=UPI0011F21BAA|nr:hypothetical protein [Aquimarina sp. RZ0]KAA1246038.1 hypothetical protein F0000_09290 [Aquimarina sp. RZ0]